MRRFSSNVKECMAGLNKLGKQVKPPRYTPEAQKILEDTMVPGPYLRFLKTKKLKPDSLKTIYTKPARPLIEHDQTISPEQLETAQRVEKAIVLVHSLEHLPTALLTQIRIDRIQVTRNLTGIRVYYHPEVEQKKEEIDHAIVKHKSLLNRLIRKYTHLKPSILYKFVRVRDYASKELYEKTQESLAQITRDMMNDPKINRWMTPKINQNMN